jgi:hypothetical protein
MRITKILGVGNIHVDERYLPDVSGFITSEIVFDAELIATLEETYNQEGGEHQRVSISSQYHKSFLINRRIDLNRTD